MRQTCAALSLVAAITSVPSRANATPWTSVWAWMRVSSLPASASQTRTVPSSEPLSASSPSAESATLVTSVECPTSCRTSLPVATSDAHDAVVAAGDGELAVRAQRDGVDRLVVALETAEHDAAADVPEPRPPLVVR